MWIPHRTNEHKLQKHALIKTTFLCAPRKLGNHRLFNSQRKIIPCNP